MRLRLAAVALLLCVPAASLAADEITPSAAPSEAAAQPEKPKKVCRMETRTGSVTPRRVCRTPEQSEADQHAAHAALDDAERNRTGQ